MFIQYIILKLYNKKFQQKNKPALKPPKKQTILQLRIQQKSHLQIKEMIKQLTKQVAEQLCAQQVITNICDCIKQLVDNSIDAQASRIEVLLEEYGKKKIQVRDDGLGIPDFGFLAAKGATSKNKGNYQQATTLGFRGQALHSIAKISQKMQITSTHTNSSTGNTHTTTYNTKNNIQQTLPSRSPGTTVQIQSIFQYLPVRRYELLNKFKQFFRKIDEMIKEYCIGYPRVVFVLKNVREGRQELIVESSVTKADQKQLWRRRIQQILGIKVCENLVFIKTDHAVGWILKNIESGSSRQNTYIRKTQTFTYLNNRPIDAPTRLLSLFNQYYRKYNKSTKYIYILNLVLPWDCFDVNLTPNKREIFIKEALMDLVLGELRTEIQKNVVEVVVGLGDFGPKGNERLGRLVLQGKGEEQKQGDGPNAEHIISQLAINPNQNSKRQDKISKSEAFNRNSSKQLEKQYSEYKASKVLAPQMKDSFPKNSQIVSKNSNNYGSSTNIENKDRNVGKNLLKNKLIQSLNQRMSVGGKKDALPTYASLGIKKIKDEDKFCGQNKQKLQIEHKQKEDVKQIGQQKQMPVNYTIKIIQKIKQIKQENTQQEHQLNSTKHNQDILPQKRQQSTIRTILPQKKSQKHQNPHFKEPPQLRLFPQSQQQILPERTTHNIPKSAFTKFVPLGQFNLGFIVCYYEENEERSAEGQKENFGHKSIVRRYYLVDQHAASEKYHFEKLLKDNKNFAQKCQKIYVNPIQRDAILQHRQALQKSGYRFEHTGPTPDQRQHITLLQAPIFLNKIYGKQYFLQLSQSHAGQSQLTQHPDYYSAAATKACRTAVMVGDVLEHRQMKGIVTELAGLGSPWNCPHGRPTLIYLGDRAEVQRGIVQERTYTLE